MSSMYHPNRRVVRSKRCLVKRLWISGIVGRLLYQSGNWRQSRLGTGRRHTNGWADHGLGWGLELVRRMWSLNYQPHQTRPTLQRWQVHEPPQSQRLPRTMIFLRSQTLLPHLWLTQRVCRSVCTPHQTWRKLLRRTPPFWVWLWEHVQHGKVWKCLGEILRVTLIITEDDHAGRRGDRL